MFTCSAILTRTQAPGNLDTAHFDSTSSRGYIHLSFLYRRLPLSCCLLGLKSQPLCFILPYLASQGSALWNRPVLYHVVLIVQLLPVAL